MKVSLTCGDITSSIFNSVPLQHHSFRTGNRVDNVKLRLQGVKCEWLKDKAQIILDQSWGEQRN